MRIRTHRAVFAGLLILAGCSSQQDEELVAVKGAHSAASEWAAVERLTAASRVSQVYTGEMREMAKDELKTDRASIRDPNAARAVDTIRGGAAPTAVSLASAARALAQAEKSLETR